MRKLCYVLGIVLALMGTATCFGDTGLQAIGFSRWTTADVNATVQMYRQVGGNLELAFLPFEFNPDDPFSNATYFVQKVLPGGHVELRITVHLLYRADHFWTIPLDYTSRVQKTDQWISQMRMWAAQNGLADKLGITVCPYLEDKYDTYAQYSSLLNSIVHTQAQDKISTPFRRAPISPADAFRVGNIPHEYHSSSPGSNLRRFDRWSNDGITNPEITEAEFLKGQAAVLQIGASSLYWTKAFNGTDIYPKSTPPSQRFNLSPFQGSMASAPAQKAMRILSAR